MFIHPYTILRYVCRKIDVEDRVLMGKMEGERQMRRQKVTFIGETGVTLRTQTSHLTEKHTVIRMSMILNTWSRQNTW